MSGASNNNGGQTNKPPANKSNPAGDTEDELPEELKGCTKELIERIEHDIVDSGEKVSFRDIAGLEHAKKTVVSSDSSFDVARLGVLFSN